MSAPRSTANASPEGITAPVARNSRRPRYRRTSALLMAALLTPAGLSAVAGRLPARAAEAAGAWRATGLLAAERADHTATLLDGPACRESSVNFRPSWCGKVLIAGGGTNTAELHDPRTGESTPTRRPMGAARSGHTATLLSDGRVLVVGGRDVPQPTLGSSELYDPVSGEWTAAGDVPGGGRADHTATLLRDGRVLIAGGFGRWTGGKSAFSCYDVLDVCEAVSSAAVYTPSPGAAGAWTATLQPMTAFRARHSATLLGGPFCEISAVVPYCGKVLVAGGTGFLAPTNYDDAAGASPAELYDPATGTWVSTGPLVYNRQGHTATLLLSGHVLAAGGQNCVTNPLQAPGPNALQNIGYCSPTASAELYDPLSRTWTPTSSLNEKRLEHTATLLDGRSCPAGAVGPGAPAVGGASSSWCGKVLVAGGGSGPGSILHSAELFDLNASGRDDAGRTVRGAWAPAASLVQGRAAHAATYLGDGEVLATGGAGAERGVEVFDSNSVLRPPSVTSVDPATGPTSGFTSVVISGAGFDEKSTVRFGEMDASFSRVESSTRISATSPPADRAGSVDVTVTTPGGTSLPTLATRFTYYEPNGTWSATAAMTTPREGHTATRLLDGRVLVAGGLLPGNAAAPPTASAEVYDPRTETWKPTGPLHHARANHTATLLDDGRVLVAGGKANGSDSETAEIYDPGTGTWAATTDTLTVARSGHTATPLPGGKVLVAGGGSETSESYDPQTGAWDATTGTLSVSRLNHTATDLGGGRVLVAGGDHIGGTSEVYDPESKTWMKTNGTLSTPRSGHKAALLPGQKVLVMGGGVDDAGTDTSEVYHSGTWTVTEGALSSPRYGHVAADLGGGRILVAGGHIRVGMEETPLALAEIYDPATARWQAALPLLAARYGHTATVLTDGRVLVVGGVSSGRRRLATAEVFDSNAATARLSVLGVTPSVGTTSGGTPVTITGSGFFDPGTRVSFGGISPKEVTIASDREITAVTPRHAAGVIDVNVTIPRGTSVQAQYHYAAGGWSATSHLDSCQATSPSCAGRDRHTATALDAASCRGDASASRQPWCGKVLVVGGTGTDLLGTGGTRHAQLYDPASASWAPAASMLRERRNHTATLLGDGTVLVVGAPRSPVDGAPSHPKVGPELTRDYPEVYDPRSDVWAPTPPVKVTRLDGHTATRLEDGSVLLSGGMVQTVSAVGAQRYSSAASERYDPQRREWSFTSGQLEVPRRNHTATPLGDGGILVVGGVGDGDRALASSELYEPSSATWTLNEHGLAAARSSHTATLLRDGSVLVVGGDGPEGAMASVELYDPTTKTWTSTGALFEARSSHTATLLPDGKVLVAGGTVNGVALESSEVYDPATRRWSYTSPMSVARMFHSATLLEGRGCASDCGRVVVVGGTSGAGSLASAELFAAGPEITGLGPKAGPSAGGTSVVITGRSLDRATAVSFGGVPAGFTVKSPTEIVAVTPPHEAGTVEVVVTTPGGSSLANPPKPNEFTFVSSGVPGEVDDLAARALSEAAIELTWTTAGSDGVFGPPATRYVIKESSSPIENEAAFAAASTVCDGACSFPAASLGRTITFSIDGLGPGTGYHYALRAVGPNGVEGPISNPASVSTGGSAPVLDAECQNVPAPGSGQLVYSSGYSMVGLPAGTRVDAQSPLYGWFDLGARGSYTTQSGGEPVGEGRGYWAWFSCPRLVSVAGPGTGSLDLPLGGYRASMIGNPSGTQPVALSGHDFAARWDPALNDGAGGYHISGHREEQTLAVGEAVWAFSYRQTSITLRAR